MDITTISLAVDSTQVNTASAALDKFAASGGKAAASATGLERASANQGKALGVIAPAAVKAATGVEALADANKALGASSKAGAGVAAASLADSAAQASKAAAAAALLERAQVKLGRASLAAAAAQEKLNALQLTGASIPPARIEAQRLIVRDTAAAVPIARQSVAVAQQRFDDIARPPSPRVAAGLNTIAASAKNARFQNQQLAFQLNDFAVQVASGGGFLIPLIQQGSQLSGTFGGIGNAVKAVAGLITPFRLAIGGAATAVGALAFAFLQGEKQSRAFADALQVSGNFAGQTEGKFNALTKSVAAATASSVGNVREFGQALLRTGEVGPQVFAAATRAAVTYGEATGKTADEVAKDFAAMARAPAKFAIEANRSLNFLTAAQVQSIKAFEENGRAADAQGVIYDALNQRFGTLDRNLGTLDRALNAGKNAWSSFWSAAFDIGRAETIEQKLAKSSAAVDRARPAEVQENGGGAGFVGPNAGRRRGTQQAILAAAQGEQTGNLRRLFREQENAAATAISGATEKAGIAARTYGESALTAAKHTSALSRELAKNALAFKEAADANVPFTKAQQDAINAKTRKDFAPAGGSKRVDTEPDQVRQALLAADLRFLQDQLRDERDAIAFNNRESQALFQAGNVSLATFFEQREQIARDGVRKATNALIDEQARLEVELENPLVKKNPSEEIKLRGQLAEAIRDADRVQIEGNRQARLGTLERDAALKQLVATVSGFRANLLELEGNTVGAAAERAKQQIEQARELFRQAQGTPSAIPAGDQGRIERAIVNQVRLQQIQTETGRITERLAIEEERIALKRQTGALTESAALVAEGEARRKVVGALEAQLAAQEALAQGSQNPQLLLNIERTRLELEKLKATLDPLKDKFDNLFKDAGATAIERFLNNPRDIKGALKGFAAQITGQINADIAKEFSGKLFGEGGIFGGAGGLVSSTLFGGKSPAAAKPVLDTSAVTQSLDNFKALGLEPGIEALQRFARAADSAQSGFGQAAQTQASPFSLDGTFRAANEPAFSLGGFSATGEQSTIDLFKAPQEAGIGLGKTLVDARTATQQYLDILGPAAQAVGGMGQAGTLAALALRLLPGVIQSIQLSGSTSGNPLSFLSSLVGDSGGEALPDLAALFFHGGGIVGKDKDVRQVPAGVFGSKTKAANAPSLRLAPNEVPAILMGGPKGKREEVLRGDDPRHRDNMPPALLKIMQATRYHTGGIAGQKPDLLQPGRPYVMQTAQSGDANKPSAQGGSRNIVVNVNQSFNGPQSKQTLSQGAAQAARAVRGEVARGTA